MSELLLLIGGLALGYWLVSEFLYGSTRGQTPTGAAAPDAVADDAPWHVVLGVRENASREQVVAAWRRQIRQCHPDKVINLDEPTRRAAEARASRLNAAYSQAPKRKG